MLLQDSCQWFGILAGSMQLHLLALEMIVLVHLLANALRNSFFLAYLGTIQATCENLGTIQAIQSAPFKASKQLFNT